ncbi:hypothetical protein AB0I81_16975 [Nonomuraea sp. NPDC050404]|uniref:hypothetical protein n=1 Tax=Nonomuraea sp. NPDC050404 TaxID=3155783 RepID=UPI0033F85902
MIATSYDINTLTANTRNLLLNGSVDESWDVARDVANGCVRAGWTFEQYRAAMRDPNNLGGEFAWGSTKQMQVDRRLGKLWENAEDFAADWADTGPEAIRQRLAVVWSAVERTTWTGRAGGTDRKVMLGILSICDEHGIYTPTVSLRRLAEYTSVPHRTVSRSLARLVEAGWLAPIDKTNAHGTRTYEVVRQRNDTYDYSPLYINKNSYMCHCVGGHQATLLGPVPVCPTHGIVPNLGQHPMFVAPGGLGDSAERVWACMKFGELVTAKDLADRTGRNVETVRRALKRLCGAGLAGKVPGHKGEYLKVGLAFNGHAGLLARQFGVDTYLASMKQKHKDQRLWWDSYKTTMARMRKAEAKQELLIR